LPSSATTIDRDIREGIPLSRLAAYARCLGLPPDVLASPSTDIVAALGAPLSPHGGEEALPVPGGRGAFPERYQEYNRALYVRELFEIAQGVYRLHYILEGLEDIHRCAFWVRSVEAHDLRGRGYFMMFGNENPFDAVIFRWHNNLHLHFLCENGLELGYAMFIDPLRHNLVLQRDPFWLKGRGMTDRGLADNVPVTFALRMEKLPQPEGMSLEDLYRRECADVFARPVIVPGEPEYAARRNDVLTPDDLL